MKLMCYFCHPHPGCNEMGAIKSFLESYNASQEKIIALNAKGPNQLSLVEYLAF